MLSDLPDLVCTDCGTRYPVAGLNWRCDCGGLLDVAPFPTTLDPLTPGTGPASMWRYADVLPVPADPRVTLGEGLTPLIPSGLADVRLKLDLLMPTLSFKDRGAVVLATLARRLGVRGALLDSSGNAGTAAAAYFARAGIPCTVFVPASTSPGKLAQMRAHGADVELVPGTRADTSAAAVSASGRPGVLYASHVFHPYFLHGVKTYGYELWEQCGGTSRSGATLPETVVVPVGNGTLVLGCHLAFTELLAAGLIDRMPRIVAVQAEPCSPLERAMAECADTPLEAGVGTTVAEGIAISSPPRGAQILRAIRATGGTIVGVTDDQIRSARADLAGQGLFVEPTSAVCWAAVSAATTGTFDDTRRTWRTAAPALAGGTVVVPLCGAGLKSPAP